MTIPHTAQDFWNKVDIREIENCWLWQGKLDKQRYGIFGFEKKVWRANRLSWKLHNNQEIPIGKLVCHSCDTPQCCNPHHLWIGTHKDNTQDILKKGRWGNPVSYESKNTGVTNGQNIFSENTIIELIDMKGKISSREASNLFGIDRGYVNTIWAGKRWKHLHRS